MVVSSLLLLFLLRLKRGDSEGGEESEGGDEEAGRDMRKGDSEEEGGEGWETHKGRRDLEGVG